MRSNINPKQERAIELVMSRMADGEIAEVWCAWSTIGLPGNVVSGLSTVRCIG